MPKHSIRIVEACCVWWQTDASVSGARGGYNGRRYLILGRVHRGGSVHGLLFGLLGGVWLLVDLGSKISVGFCLRILLLLMVRPQLINITLQ